ncbi:MAG: glutamine--fructose-6-phosphate transaminase (isomerizing) [Lachnospiraceae bacterium]|nr:glutamine--fructose-6-phosphate transaminase (isomerizing) [Lachnospiraceae bacterium]
MCGIVGYIGKRQAAPVILDGLERLEYRGYDSAGIAVQHEGAIQVAKATGRLEALYHLTRGGTTLLGTSGIGHTRWATHGVPNDVNAHPHTNEHGTIAVVQNGIIENYIALRERLKSKGYTFVSETDTEVVAHLLDYYYQGDARKAIIQVLQHIEGSYALGIQFADQPEAIFGVRKGCPLIIGLGDGETFMASDVTAVLKHTRRVMYPGELEIAELGTEGVQLFTTDEEPVTREVSEVAWDISAAEKGGYEHFMLKEMMEQPKVVRDTLSPHIRDGRIEIEELKISDEDLARVNRVFFVACGSAYHTGVTAKYIFESLARLRVETDLASEFIYRDPLLDKDDLVVVISQSGETADTKEALKMAREAGCRVLAIVNVVGSSIAREADFVMYTMAGPEIAVATTKAYSAQLIDLYLLAMKFASARGYLHGRKLKSMMEDLAKLPEQIELMLNSREKIQRIANRFIAARDVFFIGRGIDYAISLEGSLKLKEISYIHSEAYAAGELKHGTIALLEEGSLVAAVSTQPSLHAKLLSNIKEVKARGAVVLGVTTMGNREIEQESDFCVTLPETNPLFANSLAIIPLQMLAYYIAVGRGCDVDKPRNLAKSVTVE